MNVATLATPLLSVRNVGVDYGTEATPLPAVAGASFSLRAGEFRRLGQRLAALGVPTVFVLEGGYAAEALGANAAQVLEGFEGER